VLAQVLLLLAQVLVLVPPACAEVI